MLEAGRDERQPRRTRSDLTAHRACRSGIDRMHQLQSPYHGGESKQQVRSELAKKATARKRSGRQAHDSRRETRRRGRHRARRRDRNRNRASRRGNERRRMVRGGEPHAPRHGASRARVLPRGGRGRDHHQHLRDVPARAGRRGARRRDGGHQPARGGACARGAGPGGARPAGGGRRLHVQHPGMASGNHRSRPRLPPVTRAGGGGLSGNGRHPCGSGVRFSRHGNDDGCRACKSGYGGGTGHRAPGVGGHQHEPGPGRRDGRLGHRAGRLSASFPKASSPPNRNSSRRSSTRSPRSILR